MHACMNPVWRCSVRTNFLVVLVEMDARESGSSIDVVRRQLEEQRRQLTSHQDECIKVVAKLERRKKKMKARASEIEAEATARQAEMDSREAAMLQREKQLDRFARELDLGHAKLMCIHKELQSKLQAARDKAQSMSQQEEQQVCDEGREDKQLQSENPPAPDLTSPAAQNHEREDVKKEELQDPSDHRMDGQAKRQRVSTEEAASLFSLPPVSSHPPQLKRFLPSLPNPKPFALNRGLESLPREKMVEALSRTHTMDNQAQPSHPADTSTPSSSIQRRIPSVFLAGPQGRQESSKEQTDKKTSIRFQLSQFRAKKRRESAVTAEDIRDDALLQNTIDLLRRSVN
jgi:hypothetical protein